MIYNVITKGRCYSSQTLSLVNFKSLTVRGPAGRSMRFYTENVQQNYCTYEKLKSLFLHTRHLLPAADCGKGKEGLTAKSNSVRQYYIMRSRNLSTSRPSGRFFHVENTASGKKYLPGRTRQAKE